MRATEIDRQHKLLSLFERRVVRGMREGITRVRVGSEGVDGRTAMIEGRRVLNFGTCSYMGLDTDQRLKDAACAAIQQAGVIYASSVAFSALDLYSALEEALEGILGGSVVVTPTVTHAHLSALPVLVESRDTVLIDAQTHASVHLALQVLAAEGVGATILPHDDPGALERAVAAAASGPGRVWYLADGVYSMFGDLAPFDHLTDLLDRYDNLRLYIDDAHGFSWHGAGGRGFARERLPRDPRVFVTVSLGKSFGGGGGALVTDDEEAAGHVRILGGPLIFGGPLQPAELAVAVESARIHTSPEGDERRAELDRRIGVVLSAAAERGVTLTRDARTPIWHVPIGGSGRFMVVARRLLDEGLFVNPVTFPAVPISATGIRFTQTLHHDEDDLVALLDALARVLGETGAPRSPRIDLTDM